MAEAKVFPMSTFVSCLRGGDASDASVNELLAHITQAEVDADFVPFAAALSKGFIYEKSPDLTKFSKGEIASLGQKVSIESMSDDELAQAADVLAKLTELKKTNAEQAAKIAELEAANKTLSDDLAVAKGKLKTFEAQAAQGDQKLEVTASKMDEHIKKLEDLMAEVAKVKSQGVVVAGVAGEAGAEGAAADAGGDAAPSSEAGEDFGFSGGGSDPFADSGW